MGKSIFNLLIVLLVGFVSEGNAQTINNMDNKTLTQEQQNVLMTIEHMVSAFEAKDIEGVMATYEQDATVVFEPENPISTTASVKETFEQAFQMNPQYTFGDHEVFVMGKIAVHLTPWEMIGTMPDGTEVQQSGLSIAVLRKQTDGSWLMIFDNPHGQFVMQN